MECIVSKNNVANHYIFGQKSIKHF
ncbi:hypothetical protein CP8484711_0329A, partial [Chlamydia psittaci 84-8471/1]